MRGKYFSGVVMVLAAGLALGGCDNKHKSDSAKEENGHAKIVVGNTKIEAADEHGGPVALPESMPPYAAVYPGADVRAVVTTNQESMTAMITYVTTAKPEDVLAFHKKNAQEAGLTDTQDVQVGGLWHFAAEDKAKKINLTVTIVAEDGKYSVQETYK
jgi:hypothetical protein